jgi:hypothetical protein
MRYLLIATIIFTHAQFIRSNGGPYSSGTAQIDETHLEGLSDHEKKMRERAARNPRNRSFPGSFKKVGEEEGIQKMESLEGLEEFQDDPFIENRGNGQTTNQSETQKDP